MRRDSLPVGATVGLTPRIVAVLRNAGIETFQQLAMMSDAELLQIGSIGYAALREIREALQHLGLTAPEQQVSVPFRTPFEEELWQLTAPAGGVVERGIAMVHFGWNGRLPIEQLRDRYRVKRDLLRRIFLSIETQPVPENRQAIQRVARFVRAHIPRWADDIESLLITAGLTRQHVTVAGIVNACRIAALDPGFEVVTTPRLLVVPTGSVEACRAVIRSVQHLAAIRGIATIDEVKSCAETLAGVPIDRKFARRAVALLSNVQWLDYRLGIVTIHRVAGRDARAQRREARETRTRMQRAS